MDTNISFQIVGQEQRVLKTTTTLKDMWNYIRMYINVPQNWNVEELHNDVVVDSVNACYLTDNFKDENKLPLSIKEIE